jgi:hypothetical protein
MQICVHTRALAHAHHAHRHTGTQAHTHARTHTHTMVWPYVADYSVSPARSVSKENRSRLMDSRMGHQCSFDGSSRRRPDVVTQCGGGGACGRRVEAVWWWWDGWVAHAEAGARASVCLRSTLRSRCVERHHTHTQARGHARTQTHVRNA